MTTYPGPPHDFGAARFYANSEFRGPVVVACMSEQGVFSKPPITLPNLKPLLVFAKVLEHDRGTQGAQFTSVPLEGPEGKLSIPAQDLLAFVAHLRECYPRSLRSDAPEFYRLTHELRWWVPASLSWQPLLSLQQRWEHIFGFEPDVWLPIPVVETPAG